MVNKESSGKQALPKPKTKTVSDLVEAELSNELSEVKREWKHFIKFKDENYLLFTAFVLLVAAIVVINTIYVLNRSNAQPASSASNSPDPNRVLRSEMIGSNGMMSIKVSNVTENDKTDYAFASDPDSTMLILDISITNTSAASHQLIPANQFYVRSSDGDYAALHASMYVTKPLDAVDLAPGKTASGQLSFSVPKRVAHPHLYVDTGWGGLAPIVYSVLR